MDLLKKQRQENRDIWRRKQALAAPSKQALTQCAYCGGQFPTFRAICPECQDSADADGYRDGKTDKA